MDIALNYKSIVHEYLTANVSIGNDNTTSSTNTIDPLGIQY